MIFVYLMGLFSWFFWISNSLRTSFPWAIRWTEILFLTSLTGILAFIISKKKKATAVIILAFSLIPFLRYFKSGSFNGPISFGGYDWHAYSLMAQVLSARKLGGALPIEVQWPGIVHGLLESNVFGAYWPIMVLESITGLSFPACAVLFQALSFFLLNLIVFNFFQTFLKLDNKTSLFLALILSLSPYINFLISEAYLSQIWGMIFCFAIYIEILKNNKLRALRITALFLGLWFTYSHMLPLVLASCLVFFISEWSFNSLLVSAKQFLKLMIPPLLTTFLVAPDRFKINLENLKNMKNASAGPSMDSQYAESWLGIAFDPHFNKAPIFLEILITGLFLYGIWKTFRYFWKNHKYSQALLAPCLILGIYICDALMKTQGTASVNYKTFKIISFFLPILVAYFWYFVLIQTHSKKLKLGISVAIVLLNSFHLFKFDSEIQKREMKITDSVAALNELKLENKKISVISSPSKNYDASVYQQMLAGNFLAKNYLYYWNSTGIFPEDIQLEEFILPFGILVSNEFGVIDFSKKVECRYAQNGSYFQRTQCLPVATKNLREDSFLLSKFNSENILIFAVVN